MTFFWTDWREVVPLELVLDLRRRRLFMALLMRLAVVQELVVSTDSSLELLDESEELFMKSARTPGCDSSSMIRWGILAYR
jgi:hypothetical protein